MPPIGWSVTLLEESGLHLFHKNRNRQMSPKTTPWSQSVRKSLRPSSRYIIASTSHNWYATRALHLCLSVCVTYQLCHGTFGPVGMMTTMYIRYHLKVMENQSIGAESIQVGTNGQGAYLKHRGDPTAPQEARLVFTQPRCLGLGNAGPGEVM